MSPNQHISEMEAMKRNIHDMQKQLQLAYQRIGQLTCELDDMRRYKDAVDDGKIFLGEEDEPI